MNCPNCGTHIGRFELNQNCKSCGINLFYSQQELLLSRDAKKCELEYASFRIFVAKLKCAFINGPLQIIRIILIVACIGALFIPFASIGVNIPVIARSISFGGYGLYSGFSDGSLALLLDLTNIELFSDISVKALILIASMLLLLLTDLAAFGAELLSFINIRKSAKALFIISCIGTVLSVNAIIQSYLLSTADAAFSNGTIYSSFGFGGIVTAVLFIALAVINILIIVKKISPDIKDVDVQRVAMNKKVKRGEVSLDDLTLPVFETDAEASKEKGGDENE